jgi:hypothetical protein
MNASECILSRTIHLVIQVETWEKAQDVQGEAIPGTTARLKEELARLSCSTGIPVLLESFSGGSPLIVFCTERLEVGCSLSKMEDAYYLAFIKPLSVRRRNQLARQVVLVLTRHSIPWQIHRNPSELKTVTGLQSGYQQIRAAWERISTTPNTVGKIEPLSPAHYKFFGDVDNLIDISYEAELDRQNLASVAILQVEPVAAERYARDVYRFRVQSHNFQVGDEVRVEEAAPGETGMGYAGSVVESLPEALILSFRNQPDAGRLGDLHWIKPFNSNRQYQIQKSALRALRDGSSANPHLLNILVDGRFATTTTPLVAMEPTPDFNDSQRTAIGHADTVPDLLLVVGPPGTGKTKCISEMARRHARLKKRVLVTSKNNKAVDNALEKLQGLEALRIGREEKISTDVQPLMIDAKARGLQQRILANTRQLAANLDRVEVYWPKIEIALGMLEQNAAYWQEAIQECERQEKELGRWEDEVYRNYQPGLERLQKVMHSRDQEIARITAGIEAAARKRNGLLSFTRLPLIGLFFKRSSEKYQAQIQELELQRSRVLQERDAFWERHQRMFEDYKSRISESVEARERRAKLEGAVSQRDVAGKTVLELVYRLLPIFTDLGHTPQSLQVVSPRDVPPFLQEARAWYQRMHNRHELLRDWHMLLGSRHQALYPALIRTAEVVGATCIGIATDARFESLDFDLVIADEAGQIQVMDLLVPLVRASRAVLVGDHKQLPPTVDQGLQDRLDAENREQREWLEKSLFERIHERPAVPANRKVMLDTQYRIPEVVADLISASFYENRYETGHTRSYADPIFNRPLVFIDTCDSPKRYDTRAGGGEGQDAGYINQLEAELLASLVRAYQKYKRPWGVIVPYKKQAELIRQKLQRQVSAEDLKDWVATVDSFQGKEREIILYGFTRSNKYRRVGFLSELRRLNVSLTRAINQLIVIGDSSFLTSTVDVEFSRLVRNLLDVARSPKGAYYHAGQIRQLLASR